MGNESSNVWLPGFQPESTAKPQIEDDYRDRGIMAAYRDADHYVYKDPGRRFCTIGPGCWLRCWEIAKDTQKIKFAKAKENVVLRFEWKKLDFEVDEELEFLRNEKIYNWGYLYFADPN